METSEQIVCKDLLTYMQDLPAVITVGLYQHSAACLAVFREMPELARLYVMRMLFLEHPLPLTVVNSWIQPSPRSQSLHQSVISKLQNLRVWERVTLSGGQEGVEINAAFKANLRVLLCGGNWRNPLRNYRQVSGFRDSPWATVGHTGEDKHSRDIPFLNGYADKQWEGLLNYMVGGSSEDVTKDTVKVLKQAGLMASSQGGQQPTITTSGFQFLLMDRSSQVWYFILQYLNTVEERGMNLIECLTFLCQLSFLTLGKDYSTERVTDSQVALLQHLRQFGMVYQRKRSSKRYYPTKLAVRLVSGSRSLGDSSQKPGFIVLETNYRVLAYTDSQLQIAILALFCQLQYRFPNMVVGTITRESIHQALMNGITAEQILSFIRLHAHPEMLKNSPVIPPTVSDQVRLWEVERNRLEFSEGVLYSEFLSASDFETVRKYAQDLGVLLWSNPGKRLMVVSPSGHDEVRRYWRRQKTAAGQS